MALRPSRCTRFSQWLLNFHNPEQGLQYITEMEQQHGHLIECQIDVNIAIVSVILSFNSTLLSLLLNYLTAVFMPRSHYRRYVPLLEVFLNSGTVPRGRPELFTLQAGGYWLDTVLTFNNSRMTVLQTLVTEKKPPLTSNHLRYLSDKRVAKRPIPQLILFRRITPKDKRITTLCTPWTTPSFTVVKKFTRTCVKSTAHAHGTKIRGGYLKPWKTTEGVTRYIMGSSSLTRTVAYRRLTVIQGQGRFTKLGLPRVILPMCIYIVWMGC